ncbi:MAG: PKD domain-containing protein [Crocinitomicaceae bacterium]
MKVTKFLKILILTLAITSFSSISFAETITVDSSLDDVCDSDGMGVGTCTSCTTAAGQCTLRAALEYANLNGEADNIEFDSNYTISVTGSLPEITEPVSIDGVFNTIEVVGDLATSSIGFSFSTNAKGSSITNLTVNSFETQLKVDGIDGQIGGACDSTIEFDNLKVGTDTTGNILKTGQKTGLYALDTKCLDILNSTFAVDSNSFMSFNVRLHTLEDVEINNSIIGLTSNKNTVISQNNNLNAFSIERFTIENSYFSVDSPSNEAARLESITDLYLAKSYFGFDSSGNKIGDFAKALYLDADVSNVTSLDDLESLNYSSQITCSESKSNICENYFGGSTTADLVLKGTGNYLHGNQFCSNTAQNTGISTGDGIQIERMSTYNKFDSNIIDGCEDNGVYIQEFDAGSGIYDINFLNNEFGENITGKIDNAINVNGGGFPDSMNDGNDENVYLGLDVLGGFIKNSQTGISINDNNMLSMWGDIDGKSTVSDIEIKDVAFGTGVTTGIYIGSDFNFMGTDYPISDVYLEGNTFESVTTKVEYATGASADDQITQPTFSSVEVAGDTLTISTSQGAVNPGEGCIFQVYFSDVNGDIQTYLPSNSSNIVSFADSTGACNLTDQEFDLSSITKVSTNYIGLVLSQGSGDSKQSQIPVQTTKTLTTATANLSVSYTEPVVNNLIPFDTLITLDGSGSSDYTSLNFDLDTNYDSDGDGTVDNDIDITLTSADPTTTFKYSDISTYLNDDLLNSNQFMKTISMTAVGEINNTVTSTSFNVFRAKLSATPMSDASPATIFIDTNDSLLPSGLDFSLDYGDGSAVETMYNGLGYTKVYSSAGQYNVVLTLTDSFDGTQVSTDTISVSATQSPIADFEVSATNLVASIDQNNSTGFGLSYAWDFDTSVDSDADGTADNDVDSTLETPTYTYAQSGTYNVKLTVTNASGSDSSTQSISVNNQAPSALNFTYTAGTLYPKDNVAFTGTAQDANSFSWDFDDITNSDLIGAANDDVDSAVQNPTTTFAVAGTYNVIFTATNSAGSTTFAKTIVISPVPTSSGGSSSGSSYSPPSIKNTSSTTTTTTTTTSSESNDSSDDSQSATDESSDLSDSSEINTSSDESNADSPASETNTDTQTDAEDQTDQTTQTVENTVDTPIENIVTQTTVQNIAVDQNETQALENNLVLPKALNLQDSVNQDLNDPSVESQTQENQNTDKAEIEPSESNFGENLTGALIDTQSDADVAKDEYVPAPQPLKSAEELSTMFNQKSKLNISVDLSSLDSSDESGGESNVESTEVKKQKSAARASVIKKAVEESQEVKVEDKQVIAKLEIDQEQRIEKSIQALEEIEKKEVSQEEKQLEISLNSDGDFCTDIYEKSIGTDPFTAGDCGIKEQVFVNNPLQAGQNILLLAKEKEVVPSDNFILNGLIEGYDENPVEDVCFYVETIVDYRLAGCSKVDSNGNFVYYNDLQLTNPLSFKAESQIQASDINSGNQFKIVAESRDGSYKSMPIEVEIDITKKKEVPTLVSFAGISGDEIQMSDDLLTNLETVKVSSEQIAAVLDIGTYAKGVVNFQSLLFSTASLTSSTSGVIQVVPPENYEFNPGTKHTFSAFAESLIDPTIKSEAVRINFEIVGSKFLILIQDFTQNYLIYVLGFILLVALIFTTKKSLSKVRPNKKDDILDLDELQAKEISDHEIEQSGLSSLGDKVEGKLEIDDSASKEAEQLSKRNKKSLL